MENNQKKTKKKFRVRFLLLIMLLFSMAIVSVSYVWTTGVRTRAEVQSFAVEMANNTSLRLKDALSVRMDAIEINAYLYGQAYESGSGHGLELIDELEQTPEFDAVYFVTREGRTLYRNKDLNISETDYFEAAKEGESGCVYSKLSEDTKLCDLAFYAPVYAANGNFCGVLVGVMWEESIAALLHNEIIGYPVSSALLNDNAMPVGTYEFEVSDITSFMKSNQELKSASLDREEYVFAYGFGRTKSVGVVQPVEGTDWTLLTAFPQEAMEEFMATHDRVAMIFLAVVIFIFFGLFAVVLLMYVRESREAEMERIRKDAQAKINVVLNGLAEDVVCLIDINVNEGTEEQFRMGQAHRIMHWNKYSGNYEDDIKKFTEEHIVEKDRERFLEATNLDYVQEYLKTHSALYTDFDAIVEGDYYHYQAKHILDDSKPDEPHIYISVLDVTDMVIERQKNDTRMNLIATAAGVTYSFIMEEDLTRNQVTIINNDGMIRKQDLTEVPMDETLDNVLKTIPFKEEREEFIETFSRSSLYDAYESGKREIVMRLRQADQEGIIHWMELRNILVKNELDELYAIAMVRCIDDDIKQNLQFEAAKNAAEAANKAKSIFLFNMSHDIRTPMNAILGFTDIARRNVKDSVKVEEYLSKIQIAEENLIGLLDHILEMARIENNRIVIEKKPADISDIVDRLMILIEADAKKKNQKLSGEMNVENTLIYRDVEHETEVYMNILTNAVKYTKPGGIVHFSFTQEPGETEDTCYIIFRCVDTGIGISKEFLEHAFDNFERERTSTDSGVSGTGLGLAIVKRLLDLMGGTVEIYSNPGFGTTVLTKIPHKLATWSDVHPEQPKAVEDQIPLDGKQVLVVEDNLLNQEIAKDILTNFGMIPEVAENGQMACDMLLEKGAGYYDVVLMDVQMPVLNGYDATAKIRAFEDKKLAEIPILAMTANAFPEDMQNAKNAGMNGHIAKPINIPKLKQTIQKVLSAN